MRTLRDKTDEHKGNKNNIKTGRRTKQKRLTNMENKLRVIGGVVGGGNGLNGQGASRNLLLKSSLHYMLTNLDLNFKK